MIGRDRGWRSTFPLQRDLIRAVIISLLTFRVSNRSLGLQCRYKAHLLLSSATRLVLHLWLVAYL